MHERKSWHKKVWKDKRIYPTYEPYPVSLDFDSHTYADGHDSKEALDKHNPDLTLEESPFITEPISTENDFLSHPTFVDEASSFRPLQLLNTLFSDRLDFLNRALEELEYAQREREKLTRNGLEDLDSEIEDCEHSLSMTLLNHPEQQRHLERKLMELKRGRHREKLHTWKDLVWLRGEIRTLQRQIESLNRTAKSAENRDPPG